MPVLENTRDGLQGESWPFRRARRRFTRTRASVQFRIVAGERYAEIQQTERLVQRTMARENRGSTLARTVTSKASLRGFFDIGFAVGEVIQKYRPAVLHVDIPEQAGLRVENEKLRQELSQLRTLLVKTRPTPDAPPQSLKGGCPRVGELLALVDDEEFDELSMLLDSGRRSLDDVVGKLGVDRAIHLSNLLGRSQVAVVNVGRLVSTPLGTALGKSLNDLTSTAPAAKDPIKKRPDSTAVKDRLSAEDK
jgi:hypothetical protein